MPRSSRSGGGGRPSSGGSRFGGSSSGPSSSFGSGSQSRGAHTQAGTYPQSYHPPGQGAGARTAPPPQQQAAPAAAPTSGGGGLFGQMASTAAGVAVGSTVGHGLSNMLFGGGAPRAAEQVPPEHAPAADFAQAQAEGQRVGGINCEMQSKDFLRCLEGTGNDVNACGFYLEQLKQCQAAARPY